MPEPACSSTARTTGPTSTRDNRANLYGELPEYESTRNEGFGKVTVTPTSVAALQRQLPRLAPRAKSDRFAPNSAGDDRHRQRGAAADRHRRRLVGDQLPQLPDVQVHALRQPDAGPARQHRRRHDHDALGTRHRRQRPRSAVGPATVPALVAGQAAFNAFVQPLIDRYGYVDDTGVRDGRRHRRLSARSSTTTTSSATPARSATT